MNEQEKRLYEQGNPFLDYNHIKVVSASPDRAEMAVELVPEGTSEQTVCYYHDVVFAKMCEVRATADQMETLTATDFWPYPTYYDLLFSV